MSHLRHFHTTLDAKLMGEVERRLWSDAEQRVPKGAYQAFMTEAIIRMLRQREVDLSPYAGTMPLEHVVFVSGETEAKLRKLLEGSSK